MNSNLTGPHAAFGTGESIVPGNGEVTVEPESSKLSSGAYADTSDI